MNFPDYSTWLTPGRLAVEEKLWIDPELRTWPIFVNWLNHILQDKDLISVIEFGCGIGLVPEHLPDDVHYLGVDQNPDCILRAMQRNPTRWFQLNDIRAGQRLTFDVVCAFSVLKHFGLHEWDEVLGKILAASASMALFTVFVTETDQDNGTEFHHVGVSRTHLEAAILQAGHAIVSADQIATGELMIVTRKC